ncbi:MAG TPA: FAD-dependent oxidoreductase [Dermatophilaceae bacterium]|jgi:3-phenylpropionate/trans-cinnamate dioxygenase ferredoxin reductase component
MGSFVIVGAGLAGAKAAEALREQGFGGRLVLLGDEPDAPYERPPLSKDYLQGKVARDSLFVHTPDWYTRNDVELRFSTTATGIAPDSKHITLDDGELVEYEKLLLTTGSTPRHLPIPGAELDGVHYLRRVGDSERLRELFTTASRLVIIGAGWIGLEVAAAARAAGVDVTILETAALPLLRVLGSTIAPVFAALHREHGVDLRLGVGVQEITGDGHRATGVQLADGTRIDADAVLVGVGATPNTGLAEQAGLTVDNGIIVDAALRSSNPDVYAAGDVARAFHPLLQTHIRVEHWANALNQPATAAAAMLGREATFDALPYFYTDQYDLGMEYVGYAEPDGYDQVVVRGDLDTREFVAFWLSQGRLLAGMNVNIWDVTDPIKALIRSRSQLDTTRLTDPSVPLESLLPT